MKVSLALGCLIFSLNAFSGFSCFKSEFSSFTVSDVSLERSVLMDLDLAVYMDGEVFTKTRLVYKTNIEDTYLIAFYGVSNQLDENGRPQIVEKVLRCEADGFVEEEMY